MTNAKDNGRRTNGQSLQLVLRPLTLVLPLLALVSGCNHGASAHQEKKAIEVIVTTPITDEVTDYQDFTGRLDALKTVEIRPRVSGYVTEAPFKEGDMVREGDLLFQIDQRTYQADLNQAEANLKQAIAEQKLQERNSVRARQMVGGKAIGKEEFDLIMANVEKASATVGAMEAARDRAKLYLEYTHVTAPMSGRISRRNVDPGNLVNADQTILTSLVTVNPMYAYFDVDERTYLELMAGGSTGEHGAWFSTLQYPVLMRLANEDNFSRTGTINFLDNRVNANTGTIRMRGVFENPAGNLKSGLFVRVRLPIGAPYRTLLIPDEAVLSDQGRKYVFVVDGDDKVVYRPVKLGQEIQSLRVIKEGVKPGERVIVSGMQRVRQGLTVETKVQPPPKPPDASLGKVLATWKPNGETGDVHSRKHGTASGD